MSLLLFVLISLFLTGHNSPFHEKNKRYFAPPVKLLCLLADLLSLFLLLETDTAVFIKKSNKVFFSSADQLSKKHDIFDKQSISSP